MKVRSQKHRVSGTGVSISTILVGLFLASAFIRLTGGTAEAIAREVGNLGLQGDGASQETASGSSAFEIDSILAELRRREASVEAREAALALREQDLAAARTAVESQIARLDAAERSLQSVLSVAETAASADVAQLTSVYENMKPKDAAPLFEQMDPTFAAGFLARMRPETAAMIIAGLKPETAYSISVILAGRHVGVLGE